MSLSLDRETITNWLAEAGITEEVLSKNEPMTDYGLVQDESLDKLAALILAWADGSARG